MTWVPSFNALPRAADDLICGVESGAEVVYADAREAEEAADRRHDFSDHLEPYGTVIRQRELDDARDCRLCRERDVEAAWSWHMGPDR